MQSRLVSIVVPVFNEEGSLESLASQICQVSRDRQWNVEVVFVDDGSRDASWSKIVALAAGDPSIGGIRFQTNAGKAAALMAGFATARGDLVITMDADLQDPPEEIPRLVETIDQGYDVVSGWKRPRHDPWHKVCPSRVFNKLIGLLTGVHLHDHVCGLKCYRRAVLRHIRIYGDLHRFLCVLAAEKGFRITEIPTLHRPRTTGMGKYGFSRFAKGFVDLLAVWLMMHFGRRPQHLLSVVGLWLMVISLLVFGMYMLAPQWLRFGGSLAWLVGLAVAVIPGLTLLVIGLVAALIVSRRRFDDLYIVAERVGWCATVQSPAEHTST